MLLACLANVIWILVCHHDDLLPLGASKSINANFVHSVVWLGLLECAQVSLSIPKRPNIVLNIVSLLLLGPNAVCGTETIIDSQFK